MELLDFLSDPYLLTLQILNGLSRGSFFFLVAVGLVLILGVMRIVNFAHGALYMLAAYTTFTVTKIFATSEAKFWLAMIIVPIVMALVGLLLERLLIRWIYGREVVSQLLLTYGLILITTDFVLLVWGVTRKTISAAPQIAGSFTMFGGKYPIYSVFTILVALAVGAVLFWFVDRTRWGRAIRAARFDREAAGAVGINVPAVWTGVFMLGVALAGLGGVLAAPILAVNVGMDNDILITSFIIVVIGGLGSMPGAIVGSAIVGLVDAFGILVAPRYALAFIFLVMIVVLLIKPWGLLGKPESH